MTDDLGQLANRGAQVIEVATIAMFPQLPGRERDDGIEPLARRGRDKNIRVRPPVDELSVRGGRGDGQSTLG